MITDKKYYSTLTGDKSGNNKYSSELKSCIEEAGKLCLDNLNYNKFAPIMMMGNIQSGKTRAFIGLMALCFDNGFDMTIILTKCSTALVKQTVSRMMAEFSCFKSNNATVGEIIAQDILDINFKGLSNMEEKEKKVKDFLKLYKGKKRIIVVKKQADNVERLNLFISELVKSNYFKRLLVVDDEADITSVGYEKNNGKDDISLRRISGAINSVRKSMHSNIEHVLMQVTATPYALYLQPENFTNENIMPIKPHRTVVLPTGKGYIGGQHYFIDSDDQYSPCYNKAKYIIQIVDQDEMNILNGKRKNSSNNVVIKDNRTIQMSNFLSKEKKFVLSSFRKWIFDALVGAAIIQLTPENEDRYLSAVLHAATTKTLHKKEKELIERAFDELTNALNNNVRDEGFVHYVECSYKDIILSVEAYNVLAMPSLDEVLNRIAYIDSYNELAGLVTEVDIKEINSDNDINSLLNIETGELKLENSLTIFVGGQVLDRGITIPNIISFFYGRDPVTMQQDTVMQHCRMFGYRSEELLSVTRFYTTYRLFTSMKEITIRDNLLRERMLRQESGEVIYLEAGGKIKACGPQKILASDIQSIMPERRYLPIGFEIDKNKADKVWRQIDKVIQNCGGYLDDEKNTYKKGDSTKGKYTIISSDDALSILELAYSVMKPYDDGICNKFNDMESVFLFSLSEMMRTGNDEIALIVRRNRNLAKMKKNNTMYQDAPDDGNNEGALARELRNTMPVLVLTEQTNPQWRRKFWWPVYYTPNKMNVGLYSNKSANKGVQENILYCGELPMSILDFPITDNIGTDPIFVSELNSYTNKIQDFFNNQLKPGQNINSKKKPKEIICPITIDEEALFFSKDKILKEIKSLKNSIDRILIKIKASKDIYDKIYKYLDSLAESQATDELRERTLNMISLLNTTDKHKDLIKNLIQEAEETVKYASDILGYFIPTGSGNCEIHINFEGIKETVSSYKLSEKYVLPYTVYVLAHEMFHALHYANVMTKSGRWLYRNKDYHKQGAVQETLAEYFAVSFAKERIKFYGIDIAKSVLERLNLNNFPKDGGYSGAIVLEATELHSQSNLKNEKFEEIYAYSLSDMPKAFDKIKALI